MGDKVITITSSCVRGHLDINKYGTQASSTNWITNGTVPTLTIDILSASRWNTCQKIQQRTIFFSWNVVLPSAEYFRYDPCFSLCFTSGLRACSVLVTSLLVACRYMALEGILIKTICHRLVKLSNCAKILLDRRTRTCYSRTFHVLKLLYSTKIMFLLKLCFC